MFNIICNILYYVGMFVAAFAMVVIIVKVTNTFEEEYNKKQQMIAEGIIIK